MAFSAYRMTYAAIWDWRYNHIPLNRGVPFEFGRPELTNATFTRRVGWGTHTGTDAYHEKNGIGGHNNGAGLTRHVEDPSDQFEITGST
ncbi:hypothetical protein CONLIGDRAFT_680933 [Coniochaeta ligniaria NRRL 30616]|uniref:Uncharacterized protein n=1 Tax=Coniochaeta ligniaria NRRL 30616 TaxID=1408157 RepID=A0A1J7JJZ1_9PEZI|nr:hypothetical protein CONLIGDRAFT_680933 [Coniochaeta ligniaria NRRL 30616]